MQVDRQVRRYTASYLNLADHLFELVLSGEKTSTIRSGFVFITNEHLLMRSGQRTATVRILAVDYSKTLGSLTEEDAKHDGFASVGALLREMRRFYPGIDVDDPVTIFRFVKVDD